MIEIEDANELTDLFDGEWPDFHDAELRSLRLEAPETGAPYLESTIDLVHFGPERNEHGHATTFGWCRTTIRFHEAVGVCIDGGFRHQNVLDALVIRERSDEDRAKDGAEYETSRYIVDLVPIPAFCAVSFLCDGGRVVKAELVPRDS